MKTLFITVMLFAAVGVTHAVEYTNAPTYAENQFYVWAPTNGVTATNALTAINNSGWFPIVGRNAATGELEPNKSPKTTWATAVQITKTGKYVFPRIPTDVLDTLNVPQEERMTWWNTYQPDIEVYNENWFSDGG